jgi:integration host factor subunit alpha
MTLARESLTDSVCSQVALEKYRSAQLVKALFEIMKKTLESGEDVLISGFGKFAVKDKKERRGRNPQTSEGLILGARRVVLFRCSGVLRDKMNGQG